jgi:uncharacterized protein YkwD
VIRRDAEPTGEDDRRPRGATGPGSGGRDAPVRGFAAVRRRVVPSGGTVAVPGRVGLPRGRADLHLEELLRNVAAAAVAVPILAAIVVASAVRRSAVSRGALIVGLVTLVGVGAIALAPREVAARPVTRIAPVVQARLSGPLRTDAGLSSSVTIDFSSPMDAASVAAALRVEPATPVALRWEQGGRRLVVVPSGPWAPSTFITVTVGPGAHDAAGAAIASPVRTSFVTRPATTVSLAATKKIGSRLSRSTAFVLTFDRPVDAAVVAAAIRITPAVKTKVSTKQVGGRTVVTITPASALKTATAYTVRLVGDLRDTDGGVIAALPRLVARTVGAPTVVRFRPLAKASAVPRDAILSVRFTEKMNRTLTAKAFTATAAGKAVRGTVTWAEGDTVLVFTPRSALPYGTRVVLKVSTKAKSSAGVAIVKAAVASFVTVEKPAAPKPPPAAPTTNATAHPTTATTSQPAAPSAGSAVGGGSWASVERYYLGLLNCTRTGGWVAANGACTSPGGRDVAALVLDAGISDTVARPYARYLAERGACDHFLDGNPGSRLRRAGYTNYRWAENLGCPSGDPKRGAVSTQLFFQSEKPYNGGHYVNLMNATYTRVGIGVWVHQGNVRIVSDFYAP